MPLLFFPTKLNQISLLFPLRGLAYFFMLVLLLNGDIACQTPSPSQAVTKPLAYKQYKDGKKEGLWKSFYADGQLKTKGQYRAGKKVGLHQEWEADGSLSLAGYYENGKANGMMKWYNGEGELVGAGNMIEGKRDGPWKICDVHDPAQCIEAHFALGLRVGTWRHFRADGKRWKQQVWENDKVLSEKCWDARGNVVPCP